MAPRWGPASGRAAIAGVVLLAAVVSGRQDERPICRVAEALVGSVDAHLTDWDAQIDVGLNASMNCSMFLEFVYLSRDRIRLQLEYIRGNFSAQEEMLRTQGGDAASSTTWGMTHMSTAASLVSAHIHIHGVLAAARPECLSENLQLLFLMSLRRMRGLLHGQLRHLWIVFQGTSELFVQGASRWLAELLELFEADLRTMETVMVSWQDPETAAAALEDGGEVVAAPPARPGPPLPPFGEREADGVALSTLEVLRRDTFEEWDHKKPVLRALLRHVFPRDGHVADLCAGSGQAAEFLNDTGLLTAYAFDPSPNIRLLSRGVVDAVRMHAEPVSLWRSFDTVICLTSRGDFSGVDQRAAWSQFWQNIEQHAVESVVLTCGTGELRQVALDTARASAPTLQLDEATSELLADTIEVDAGLCIFKRRAL